MESEMKKLLLFTFAILFSVNVLADNLSDCLNGNYPSLCNRNLLTDSQRKQADAAEKRENLKTCLTGKYPTLCRRQLLSADELSKTISAEDTDNLTTCLTGKYPSLCRKSRLNDAQIVSVDKAEKLENLNACLIGRYKALCKHEWLTSAESIRVSQAEKSYVKPAVVARPSKRQKYYGNCESGHWIDDVISDGEIVKLEDGGLWEIDAVDQIDTQLWLPASDIIVCPGKLINTDDNETAGAVRLR
jgi:hypothetical protein